MLQGHPTAHGALDDVDGVVVGLLSCGDSEDVAEHDRISGLLLSTLRVLDPAGLRGTVLGGDLPQQLVHRLDLERGATLTLGGVHRVDERVTGTQGDRVARDGKDVVALRRGDDGHGVRDRGVADRYAGRRRWWRVVWHLSPCGEGGWGDGEHQSRQDGAHECRAGGARHRCDLYLRSARQRGLADPGMSRGDRISGAARQTMSCRELPWRQAARVAGRPCPPELGRPNYPSPTKPQVR